MIGDVNGVKPKMTNQWEQFKNPQKKHPYQASLSGFDNNTPMVDCSLRQSKVSLSYCLEHCTEYHCTNQDQIVTLSRT